MNHEDVKPHAVTEALKDLPDTFRTKHVSEHAAMQAAHDSSDSEYHKSVGRYLSVFGHRHGVRKDPSKSHGPKGQAWVKSSSSTRRAEAGSVLPQGSTNLYGPQYSGDAPFTARMRFHQSHYRATVLRVACGTGPTESDPRSFGNMLLRVDGTAGLNFLTPEIFGIVKRRLVQSSDRVERYRLLHNMLSSQPMCFNLFAPLVDDLERARRMIGALLPGEVARVSKVAIEYAPEPSHEYLHDRTSFDAFVEYERFDGTRAILGIETKLTDSFSPKRYDKPEYRRWMTVSRSPWRPEAHDAVASERLNQIWRDHLLAIAMRDRVGSPYSTCRMLIVHHPLDRDAADAVESYGSLLNAGDQTFGGMTLGDVVERFESVASGEAELEWLRKFRRRYLDLAESEEAWAQR